MEDILLAILGIGAIGIFTVVTLPIRILIFPVLMIVRNKARNKTFGLTQVLDETNKKISDTEYKMQTLTDDMNSDTEKFKAEKVSLERTDREYNDRLKYYRAYFLVLNDEWHFEEQTEEEKQETTAISYLVDRKAKKGKLYNVVLQDSGANKMSVIKAVREFIDLGVEETKKAVENRGLVLKDLSKTAAEAALAKLREAGAVAIIQEVC